MQAPLLDDLGFGNRQHAGFGSHYHQVVIGDDVARRTQAVAVQRAADVAAVGEGQRSGKLVVRSKQMGMDKVATLRWDPATAQARMDNLLSAFYTNAKVNAVLSPYDGLSIGILSSLRGVGYGTPQQPFPYVSGQDAEVPSVKSIIRGEQYSTIFKDTRELAKVTVGMVDAVLGGKQPQINDTKTYNNGVKVVPSYLLKPVVVDKSNWKEILVGSGYYTEAQLK
ncbi:substrate-binding domain-containing protein [Herbaspirillum huttiense]|uniref:substrate-binding domain-containing protein n=1 Tax=Herbaspirillum huttiense TaxID=863372 RepID=UPI00381677F2